MVDDVDDRLPSFDVGLHHVGRVTNGGDEDLLVVGKGKVQGLLGPGHGGESDTARGGGGNGLDGIR